VDLSARIITLTWQYLGQCLLMRMLRPGQKSNLRSTTLLVGLPVSFIMAVGFNERKHGGFPWQFHGISCLCKSPITGSKQSSILLYTHHHVYACLIQPP